MKKLLLGSVIGSALILSGCTRGQIHFEGKKLPVEQAEEIIEDRLEDENGIDYEVTIAEETDDDTSTKRRKR